MARAYYSAEAKTKEEAKQLIEAGCSYVTEMEVQNCSENRSEPIGKTASIVVDRHVLNTKHYE
jgi:hypothetical protein